MSATIGKGGNGTCFSGGTGSGGTQLIPNFPVTTTAGEENGGIGGTGFINGLVGVGDRVDGAGNPYGGLLDLSGSTIPIGTGGVLIVFVEGTITTAGGIHFEAKGSPGFQSSSQSGNYTIPAVYPFGGGSGGGIIIIVNNDTTGLTSASDVRGGLYSSGGPDGGAYQSGGSGAKVAYTFSEL